MLPAPHEIDHWLPASRVAATTAARLTDEWADWIARDRRAAQRHTSVYASAFRACERRMVLECTRPEEQAPFEPAVLARFRRGDDRERDLLMDLTRIGRDARPAFTVAGQQERFTLKDHKGRPAIVGKVDARLYFGSERSGAPLEIKAWAPSLVDRIETFADLFESPWTRAGAYQLLAYLLGAAEPYGFLLLDRSGLPLILPVELMPNLDRIEGFLQRAESVLDHIEAGTLPDFHEDAAECRRCPFYGGACNPPLAANVARVLTDPALEADLERWHALQSAGKEWAALDGDLKKRLRGIEAGVAGHFAITGKWGAASRVELPDDLKRQYTKSDPRGRFTLSIERLA